MAAGALPSTAQCRSCGAPVRWVTMPSGRSAPLDPEPHPDGNVVMVSATRARPLTANRIAQAGKLPEPRYRSHFVTCPNASEHRRRSR